MFLFARLASDHLKNQETLEGLQKELTRFPTDLDDMQVSHKLYHTFEISADHANFSVQRLFPNQDATEADADKIYPGETNRCFVESLMKMRRHRQLSASEKPEAVVTRRIQENCETCHLLSFPGSHLKVPLIKLMFSSISCQVCHTLCQAIILLEPDWLKTRHSSSVIDIEKRQNMLCFQVQSTEAGQDMMDRMKSKWGFPMVMHIFAQQELGKISYTAPIYRC